MELRYYRYLPRTDETTRLARDDFDKMLFNETILHVVHKRINEVEEILIYVILVYHVYDATTELMYLYVHRCIR